jgi:superfamily I DNA and/or RNA helicase
VEAWGSNDPAARELITKSTLELLFRELHPDNVVMLTWQRRMPSVIADFISARFYDGRLRTGVHRQHRDPLFASPMAFINTAQLPAVQRGEQSGRDREQWGQPGYTNPAEADLLIELAVFYERRGDDWAVILPYQAQVAMITKALIPRIGSTELTKLNVGTVDSFQGGERDVILYGFTRSNPGRKVGFLDELRRANVAFSRAREQLVLVGDLDTLTMAQDRRFRDLAQALHSYLAERGDIRAYLEVQDRLTRSGGRAR